MLNCKAAKWQKLIAIYGNWPKPFAASCWLKIKLEKKLNTKPKNFTHVLAARRH